MELVDSRKTDAVLQMHGWQIHIYTFISILQGIYHTLTVNSSQSKGLLLQHACLSGAGLHRADVSAV